jgi:hypothetical protein
MVGAFALEVNAIMPEKQAPSPEPQAPPPAQAPPTHNIMAGDQPARPQTETPSGPEGVDLIAQALGEIEPAPETLEKAPPAPEPTAWDAKRWEGFGQSIASALAHGKDKPALPDGVKAEDAPATMRPLLETLGYVKAEGVEPAPSEAAPVAAIAQADIAAIATEIAEDDQDTYEDALADAATAEERVEVRKESTVRMIDIGLAALRDAGIELPEESGPLYAALDKLFGRKVPREELGRRQAARFAAEAILIAQRQPGATPVDLEGEKAKAVTEAREKWETDLAAYAERKNGQDRIERGDLATAANVGSVGGGMEDLPPGAPTIRRGLELIESQGG